MFTLARKIDLKYKTNKIILIVSAISIGLAFALTRDLMSSIYIGMGTFLTWALAREVDPKHEYSALVCAAISLINLFYYNNINLLVIFLILMVLRLLNGISGKNITLVDLTLVLILSVFMTVSTNNSIYIIPFISALITLSRLREESKLFYIFLFISVAIFLVESFYLNYLDFQIVDFSNKINIFIIAGALIFTVWINFIKIKGTLDDKGKPIDEKRIRASQMLYGNIVLLFFLFAKVSLNNLIIYFSVMVGIIVYSFFDR